MANKENWTELWTSDTELLNFFVEGSAAIRDSIIFFDIREQRTPPIHPKSQLVFDRYKDIRHRALPRQLEVAKRKIEKSQTDEKRQLVEVKWQIDSNLFYFYTFHKEQ